MKPTHRTLPAYVAVVMLATSAHANLVQNGSFEDGNYQDGLGGYQNRMSLNSGATDITGWTVGHDGGWAFVWWMSEPGFLAAEGSRSLSLDGNDPSFNAWVEQSIPTEAGKTYRVSFSYSSDGNGGPSHTQVLVDNSLIGEVFHGSGSGGPEPFYDYLDWDSASFDFVANGSSSLLRFHDATLANYNTILDNVVVTQVIAPVPEASTVLAAASIGFCVLASAIQARRRRTA